jgi:hypothetical protein
MQPSPWFPSIQVQRTVVAGVMIALFLGSLGFAFLLSGSSPARAERVSISDPRGVLNLRLPNGWDEQPVDDAAGGSAAASFSDPREPARQLLVVPLSFSAAPSPAKVLQQAIATLLSPEQRATLETIQPNTLFRRQPIVGAQFIGFSRGDEQRRPHYHLIAAITADASHYWLLYLSDLARSEPEAGAAALRANLHLLQEVLASATLEPADPTTRQRGQ